MQKYYLGNKNVYLSSYCPITTENFGKIVFAIFLILIPSNLYLGLRVGLANKYNYLKFLFNLLKNLILIKI